MEDCYTLEFIAAPEGGFVPIIRRVPPPLTQARQDLLETLENLSAYRQEPGE